MEDFCFSFTFSVTNVPGKTQLTSVDPFVQVLNNEEAKVGQSRVMRNNPHPKWSGVQVPVNRLTFGLQENDAGPLKAVFQVYNYKFCQKDDFIGSVCVQMSDIFEVSKTKTPKSWILDEQDNENCIFTLHEANSIQNNLILEAIDPVQFDVSQSTKAMKVAAELRDKSEFHFILKFRAFGLADTDVVGQSDALLEICTLNDKTIYKSEVLKNNLNPRWKPFSVPISKIAPKNKFENLLIKIYDYNVFGKNDLIGIVRFSGKLLVAAARQHVALTWKLFEKPGLVLSGSRKEKLRGNLQLQYVFANRRLPEECDLPGLQDSLVFYQRTGTIFSQYDPEDPQQMEVHDFYKAEAKCDFYGERDETAIFSSMKSSGLMDMKISSKDESDSDSETASEKQSTGPKKVAPSSRKGTHAAEVKIVDGKILLIKKPEPTVVPTTSEEQGKDSTPSEPAEEDKEAAPEKISSAENAQLEVTKVDVGNDEGNDENKEKVPEEPETVPGPPAIANVDQIKDTKPEVIQDPPSSPDIVSSAEFDKMNQSESEKLAPNETTQKEGSTSSNKSDELKIEGFKMQECNGDGKDHDNFVAIERSEGPGTPEAKGEELGKVPAVPEKKEVEEAEPVADPNESAAISEKEVSQPEEEEPTSKESNESNKTEEYKTAENVKKPATPEAADDVLSKQEIEQPIEPAIPEKPKVVQEKEKHPITVQPGKIQESPQAKGDSQMSVTGSVPKTKTGQDEGQSSSSIVYVVFGLIVVVVAAAVYHWRNDS